MHLNTFQNWRCHHVQFLHQIPNTKRQANYSSCAKWHIHISRINYDNDCFLHVFMWKSRVWWLNDENLTGKNQKKKNNFLLMWSSVYKQKMELFNSIMLNTCLKNCSFRQKVFVSIFTLNKHSLLDIANQILSLNCLNWQVKLLNKYTKYFRFSIGHETKRAHTNIYCVQIFPILITFLCFVIEKPKMIYSKRMMLQKNQQELCAFFSFQSFLREFFFSFINQIVQLIMKVHLKWALVHLLDWKRKCVNINIMKIFRA